MAPLNTLSPYIEWARSSHYVTRGASFKFNAHHVNNKTLTFTPLSPILLTVDAPRTLFVTVQYERVDAQSL